MKDNYIRISFFVITVILIGVSFMTYQNLNNYIEEVNGVRHSNQVIRAVETVLSSIRDAETGHRGYQLTRDTNYLEPYYDSYKTLPRKLKTLDSLVAENENQTKYADTLNQLVDNQFNVINQILSNARRSSLYMDQYESNLLSRGRDNMNEIRRVASKITDEEENIFKERISKEANFRNNAPIALLTYTLIALSGMTFLFIRILESLNKREIAEEKLKEKERRYRSLFERSIDPIFLANEQLRLVDVNDSFLEFFKCTREEALTFTIGSIFSDKNDFEYFGTTLTVLKQIRDFEVPLIGKDEEKKSCLINCVFIPDQASECYQGIIHDLTMRKKAERDMIIAERLSMTGKIARTIAHEVRNPLTNLNLALEQLKDEMPQDNESVRLYCDIIERNIGRIEQLIGEMLNSSKPKELRLELTPITEVIEETIALTIDRLNLNQIRLERMYAENLPRILLDKEKIKIAFLNIIINAVEAMEPGLGILKVSAILVNGSIIVMIADNGRGIAQDDVEKLFDPFHTAKPGGMGLGLTSTKNILSSHSAEVEVSSRVNEGTVFSICFKLPEYYSN